MKTKSVPSVIMLLAGFVMCIIGIVQHMETMLFIRTLLIVLIVFYIFGCIIKMILDRNFKEMEEEKENTESDQKTEEMEETEKTDSDGE